MEKAKWYFYSYASTLTGYIEGNKTINPLECELKTNSVNRVSTDTTKAYFNLYYKDTTNLCSFKPYGLIGVTIIRNKLYLPIYHSVVFDAFKNDNAALEYMKAQEKILKSKIKTDTGNIIQWLKTNHKQE